MFRLRPRIVSERHLHILTWKPRFAFRAKRDGAPPTGPIDAAFSSPADRLDLGLHLAKLERAGTITPKSGYTMTAENRVTIFAVDDHPEVSAGLKIALLRTPALLLIGTAVSR